MQLTLKQAIKIRDDFKYLEEEAFEIMGSELDVNNVVVGPYYGEKLNDFIEAYNNYGNGDNDETIARSFNPDAYCVYVFYYEIAGVLLYENIFDMLKEINQDIDLEKYGLTEVKKN